MKIQLFDPVVVAGGSHVRSGDALENVTLFVSNFCHQNVSKTTPKWLPKGTRTASKTDPEIAAKKYSKTLQKLLQNVTQNGARGGPKSSPGAPEGTPRAPGPPQDLPWTPQDLILAVPELPGTLFCHNFGRLSASFLKNLPGEGPESAEIVTK